MKTKKKHSLSWLGVDQLHQTQIYLKNVPGMSQQNDLTHFALDIAVWAAKRLFNLYEKDAAKREMRPRVVFRDQPSLCDQCHQVGRLTPNEEKLMMACREIMKDADEPFMPHNADPLEYAFGLAEWAALGINQAMRGWYERHDPEGNPVHKIWEQMRRNLQKKGGAA